MAPVSLLQVHEALEGARLSLRRLRDLATDPPSFEAAVLDFLRAAEAVLEGVENALSNDPRAAEWLRRRWEIGLGDPVIHFFRRSPFIATRRSPLVAPGRSVAAFLEAPVDASATTVEVVGVADTPPQAPTYRREPSPVAGPHAAEWHFVGWPGMDATGMCEMYFRFIEALLDESHRMIRSSPEAA